jgi:manganese oxidase
MAYNRMVPGPVIRVTEGDRVRIIVTNGMDEPHTTHWHGLFVPNDMDGVPGISPGPDPAGRVVHLRVQRGAARHAALPQPLQRDDAGGQGLYGMFIIEEKNPPAERRADREEIMLLGDGRWASSSTARSSR